MPAQVVSFTVRVTYLVNEDLSPLLPINHIGGVLIGG